MRKLLKHNDFNQTREFIRVFLDESKLGGKIYSEIYDRIQDDDFLGKKEKGIRKLIFELGFEYGDVYINDKNVRLLTFKSLLESSFSDNENWEEDNRDKSNRKLVLVARIANKSNIKNVEDNIMEFLTNK